ncbi:uncharacterized protein LOC131148474 [Malania oleifera]|uniref:uncharacterized protein LOC131148474 n=1 Tax=Malania oleifera TaxID=397392 RepID=UPI0025AE4D6E|nr:uncharacterized protein LOC131148474 [Malania oleifera]
MDEVEIARSTAEVLNRLSQCGEAAAARCGVGRDPEADELGRLRGKAWELAVWRARAAGRELAGVLAEVELEIGLQLARLLAATVDPVVAGLKEVAAASGEEVCGVCQEEMGMEMEALRGMGCTHKFHAACILQWLKRNNSCPICRYRMNIRAR